ncbi:MAG: LysR family transcriptional regulator [Marinomonas sp.]|uniref:LysR family transcriptional regulator n=1 Tax=Marinomonas sp. TaxID=1904862 RepID=UPI003C70E628
MDIKLIEDFLCLASSQNFTAAARERRVTQSAFSRRIKALEEWFGTILINREGTTFELTPQGRLFVGEAEIILRRLYNAREAVRALGSSGDCEIAVAAQSSITQTLFLNWVKRLERRLDSVYIRLISEKLPDCIELLNQGKVKYLFCYANDEISPPIDTNKFSYTTVGKDTLIPVSIPLAGSTTPAYTLPGCADTPVPFVAYTHESLFGRAVDLLIQKEGYGCFLSRRYENPFSHTLKAMTLEGLGFSWLPKSSVESKLERGKLCRAGDASWDIEFDIRLYYRRTDSSVYATALLETSLEMASELLL